MPHVREPQAHWVPGPSDVLLEIPGLLTASCSTLPRAIRRSKDDHVCGGSSQSPSHGMSSELFALFLPLPLSLTLDLRGLFLPGLRYFWEEGLRACVIDPWQLQKDGCWPWLWDCPLTAGEDAGVSPGTPYKLLSAVHRAQARDNCARSRTADSLPCSVLPSQLFHQRYSPEPPPTSIMSPPLRSCLKFFLN